MADCVRSVCVQNYVHKFSTEPNAFCRWCIGVVGVNKGKGKAIPLQAWTGSEGSRRLRLPHFKTVGT
jgi:hypothetical protein